MQPSSQCQENQMSVKNECQSYEEKSPAEDHNNDDIFENAPPTEVRLNGEGNLP